MSVPIDSVFANTKTLVRHGAWTVIAIKNEMTDTKKCRLVSRTRDHSGGEWYTRSQPVTLVVEPSVQKQKNIGYISANAVLKNNSVEVRFDDKPAESWSVSQTDDYETLWFNKVDVFSMKKHNKFLTRFNVYPGRQLLARFSLIGFTKAYNRAAQCNGIPIEKSSEYGGKTFAADRIRWINTHGTDEQQKHMRRCWNRLASPPINYQQIVKCFEQTQNSD